MFYQKAIRLFKSLYPITGSGMILQEHLRFFVLATLEK